MIDVLSPVAVAYIKIEKRKYNIKDSITIKKDIINKNLKKKQKTYKNYKPLNISDKNPTQRERVNQLSNP